MRTRPSWPERSQASDASEVTCLNGDPYKRKRMRDNASKLNRFDAGEFPVEK